MGSCVLSRPQPRVPRPQPRVRAVYSSYSQISDYARVAQSTPAYSQPRVRAVYSSYSQMSDYAGVAQSMPRTLDCPRSTRGILRTLPLGSADQGPARQSTRRVLFILSNFRVRKSSAEYPTYCESTHKICVVFKPVFGGCPVTLRSWGARHHGSRPWPS